MNIQRRLIPESHPLFTPLQCFYPLASNCFNYVFFLSNIIFFGQEHKVEDIPFIVQKGKWRCIDRSYTYCIVIYTRILYYTGSHSSITCNLFIPWRDLNLMTDPSFYSLSSLEQLFERVNSACLLTTMFESFLLLSLPSGLSVYLFVLKLLIHSGNIKKKLLQALASANHLRSQWWLKVMVTLIINKECCTWVYASEGIH